MVAIGVNVGDVGVCMCDICGSGCVLSCCVVSSEVSWCVISNKLDIPESSSLSVATTGNSYWHCSVGMKFVLSVYCSVCCCVCWTVCIIVLTVPEVPKKFIKAALVSVALC